VLRVAAGPLEERGIPVANIVEKTERKCANERCTKNPKHAAVAIRKFTFVRTRGKRGGKGEQWP